MEEHYLLGGREVRNVFWSISTRLRGGSKAGRGLRLAGVVLILCSSSHKMFCSGLLQPCVLLCQRKLFNPCLEQTTLPIPGGQESGQPDIYCSSHAHALLGKGMYRFLESHSPSEAAG